MDGLSITATALQLGSTALACLSALCKYVSTVKKADKSRSTVVEEVKSFREILAGIKAIRELFNKGLGQNTTGGQVPLSHLWAPDGQLAQCEKVSSHLLAQLVGKDDEGARPRKLNFPKKLSWPFKIKGIMEEVEKLRRCKDDMSLFLHTITLQHAENIYLSVTTAEQKIMQIQSNQTAKLQDETVAWLNYFDCTDKHNSIRRKRQKDTCTWISVDKTYVPWRDSSEAGVLWLTGIPGAGKTFIASAIIDEFLGLEDVTLAYFYCDFREEETTYTYQILRSLIAQLLTKSKEWLSSFTDLRERKERGSGPPSDYGVLCNWLLKAAKLHDRTIVVIDALDECKSQELKGLLEIVIPRIKEDGHLRLLLTSRTEQIIKESLKSFPWLLLQYRSDVINVDIETYINKELQSGRKFKYISADLQTVIKSTLLLKAGGMFRWVECQLNTLSRCMSTNQIQEVLKSLPKGLDETYNRILLAIDEFQSLFVRRALTWLIIALKPLTIEQVYEAVKIELDPPGVDDDNGPMDVACLLEACGSLVSLNEWTKILTLSHFSVKEYLISEEIVRAGLKQYYISPPEAHQLVAMSSITYIFHGRNEGRCHQPELTKYCFAIGPLHVKHAGQKDDGLLQHLIDAFRQRIGLDSNELPSIYHDLRQHPELFMLLFFGPLKLVQSFLDHYPDVINGEGIENPLQFAIIANRLDVVLELLKRGQDPMWPASILGPGQNKQSGAFDALALMLAQPGYTLEDYELVCSNMKTVSPNILHRSVLGPQQWYPSLIRLLLEWGANPGLIDDHGFTALHYCLALADDAHCLDIVRLLVDFGCPIDTPAYGRTPVGLAAFRGLTPVVRFLLDRGCQVPEDILVCAKGSACFCLLLQRGAGSPTYAGAALTALFRRSWPGRTEGLEIVKALLEVLGDVVLDCFVIDAVSCDITTAQYILDSGGTLLGNTLHRVIRNIGCSHLATLSRNVFNSGHPALQVDCIRLQGESLLERIHILESNSGRPPFIPNLPTYFEIITFFTRQNAHRLPSDVYKCDDNSATPLHVLLLLADPDILSAEELLEVVRSFVDTGCDILAPDAAGKTPLHHALMLQHGGLVSYLVSKDAQFSNVKNLDCIPLSWAAHLPWYQTAIEIAKYNGDSISVENTVNRSDRRKTYQFDGSRIDDQASLDARGFEDILGRLKKMSEIVAGLGRPPCEKSVDNMYNASSGSNDIDSLQHEREHRLTTSPISPPRQEPSATSALSHVGPSSQPAGPSAKSARANRGRKSRGRRLA